MIKRPVNFAVGIFCLLCFVISIVNGRDVFTLIIDAILTAINITVGLV